jgi:hypothetical protein
VLGKCFHGCRGDRIMRFEKLHFALVCVSRCGGLLAFPFFFFLQKDPLTRLFVGDNQEV